MTVISTAESDMTTKGMHSEFLYPGDADTRTGRLRYLVGGRGSAVVLLHTVRTQAEHFHKLIPLLLPNFTVYALDFPGMGHSDIVNGASYNEPDMRQGVERLLTELDLTDVVLIGESMGAVVAMTTARAEPHRVRRVVAVNPYDYQGGILRSSLFARVIISGVLAPLIGPTFAKVEPKTAVRAILRGGVGDKSALTDEYLDELLTVGRKAGYSKVARAVYGNLPSLIAARSSYSSVSAPVDLVYGEKDWSRQSDRDGNAALLPAANVTVVPGAGHFLVLERPDVVAALIKATLQG